MSWLLAFVGFSILIILHELGHFAVAKWVGMRVERFSLFFPPLIWRKQVGETEYAIGALPLGGYVKITGMNPAEDLPDEVRTRAYTAQPVWKRVATIAAGPAVNLILALILLFVFAWLIGPREATNFVDAREKGYPAETQLQSGDKVISIDGETKRSEFTEVVAAHKCAEDPPTDKCRATTPAHFVVERDGRRVDLEITPVYDDARDRTRVGFTYAEGDRDPYGAGEAAEISLDRFWFITQETVKLPLRLLDAEKRKEISGVVGSYEVTRQTILDDIADVVLILAVISLSLAIINLFPFLPLDGGHIFWSLVEKVRGKAVSYATMERASVVGFMLVIGLFMVGFLNDIDRLQNGGFDVR